MHEPDVNKILRNSFLMDPFISLYTYLTLRAGSFGPPFYDFSETNADVVLDRSKALSSNTFIQFICSQVWCIGIGVGDVKMYTGRSIKTGSDQMYRFID